MLKKIKAAALATMLAFGTSMSVSMPTSFAMVDESSVSIGGIYVGMSIDDLLDAYGEPDRIEYNDVYCYDAHDLVVEVSTWNKNVFAVNANADCDLVAAGGFGIGDSMTDVIDAYGQPDKIQTDYANGDKWYVWRGDHSSLHIKLVNPKTFRIGAFRLIRITNAGW